MPSGRSAARDTTDIGMYMHVLLNLVAKPLVLDKLSRNQSR
jgi:hypothetical protein